ncbi:Putative pentatricopeptide repeat-containing protein At3g11460, mitochondrial, partial [Linum perenne]
IDTEKTIKLQIDRHIQNRESSVIIKIIKLAFERVIELEPTNIGYYVLLSNIYTDAGNSEGILRIRLMMRERKLKKDPGCSYVEFMGKVHLFLSGDKSHPQSK